MRFKSLLEVESQSEDLAQRKIGLKCQEKGRHERRAKANVGQLGLGKEATKGEVRSGKIKRRVVLRKAARDEAPLYFFNTQRYASLFFNFAQPSVGRIV